MNGRATFLNAYARRAKHGEGYEFVIRTLSGKEEVVRAADGEPFETKEAAMDGGKDAFFKAWRSAGDKREQRKQLKQTLTYRWHLGWWLLKGLCGADREKPGVQKHLVEKAEEAEQAFWLLDPGPDSWKAPLPRHHRTKPAAEVARATIHLVLHELQLTARDVDRWGARFYPVRWKQGWLCTEIFNEESGKLEQLVSWPFELAKESEYVTREGILKRKGSKVPGWMPGEGPLNWPTFEADEKAAREKSGIDEAFAREVKEAGTYEG